MAKPGETLSLNQLLEVLMQETQDGLQKLGITNPEILKLCVEVNVLSSLETTPSKPLGDAIRLIITTGLGILSYESKSLTSAELTFVKRILAHACLIKNRTRRVLDLIDIKELNNSSDDLFKGVIDGISELYGQSALSNEPASSSTTTLEITDPASEFDSNIEQLYKDYLSNNKALFVLDFNQSLMKMLRELRSDELLVIAHLYPQGFNHMYPNGYMMAWILVTAIHDPLVPLFVLDSLWMQGMRAEQRDFLAVVRCVVSQLKHLLSTPLNALDKDKLDLVLDRILDIAFTEPSLIKRFYSNIDWFVLLASKGYFTQLERLLTYKPGLEQLTETQLNQLLTIFSQIPVSVELIKIIYHLKNNQYVTSNHFRDINPVFSNMLDNALEHQNIALFQFLITRQPMCSGHTRFLLDKAVAFDRPWAVDMLLSMPDLAIDSSAVLSALKSGAFVHVQKMIGHLSLGDNGRVLFNLINETLKAKLTRQQKINYVALLFRMLNIGVPEAMLVSLIQLVAQQTRKQSAALTTYQIIVLGMLLTPLQRERTIDLKAKSFEQSRDDVKLLMQGLGFVADHPHHKIVSSYFLSIDNWVMHQRTKPGYRPEPGATMFVTGVNSGYSHWLQKRYFFHGITDNFFQAFICFIQQQPYEKKIVFKEVFYLLDSAFIWAGKFKAPHKAAASISSPTIGLFSSHQLANTGSVDRIYSSSVPALGHKRLSQSAFFSVERSKEQSLPEPSATVPDDDLLFVMDEDLSSPASSNAEPMDNSIDSIVTKKR